MRQNRPASITVIAILHFVFGGLGLACNVCGGAIQLAGGGKAFGGGGAQAEKQEKLQADIEKFQKEKLPNSKLVSYGGIGLGVLLALLMIIGGIGLLRLQSWGRTLSLIYAGLSIATNLFLLVYTFAFTVPLLKEFATHRRAQGPVADDEATVLTVIEFGGYLSAIVPLLSLIYAIMVLIIMMRPNVKAAFQDEAVRSADNGSDYGNEPEDYRDEPEER